MNWRGTSLSLASGWVLFGLATLAAGIHVSGDAPPGRSVVDCFWLPRDGDAPALAAITFYNPGRELIGVDFKLISADRGNRFVDDASIQLAPGESVNVVIRSLDRSGGARVISTGPLLLTGIDVSADSARRPDHEAVHCIWLRDGGDHAPGDD